MAGQPASAVSSIDPPRGFVHWNSQVHPENSGAGLFLPDKEAAEKFRAMGFTTVLSAPSSGIFRGSSALVSLGDGSANALLVEDNVTQNVSFSRDPFYYGYPTSLMGTIALIRQTFIDANWYRDALRIFANNSAQERPEEDKSLTALEAAASGRQPVIFETTDEQNILRASKIAKEFSLVFWIWGNGYEYRRLETVKETDRRSFSPSIFPMRQTLTLLRMPSMSVLRNRHWDFAPENPARLKQAGVQFALTTSTLKDVSNFRILVRTAIERGLKADDALAALTTIPAKMLGMEKRLGTIEAGKAANFVLADGELFGEKTKIRETWVDGKRYEVKAPVQAEARGTWSYSLNVATAKKDTGLLIITGEPDALSGMVSRVGIKVKTASVVLAGKNIALVFTGDSIGYAGIFRLTGVIQDSTIVGTGELPDGSDITWSARLMQPFVEPPDTTKKTEALHASFDVVYPERGVRQKNTA